MLPLGGGNRRQATNCPGAAAAVFVSRAALDLPSPLETLATLYKLTPAELRVLMAIVEVGGVPEVAPMLGISETTVKTHLQRIFDKTGNSRQADLIKLVAGSMVHWAAERATVARLQQSRRQDARDGRQSAYQDQRSLRTDRRRSSVPAPSWLRACRSRYSRMPIEIFDDIEVGLALPPFHQRPIRRRRKKRCRTRLGGRFMDEGGLDRHGHLCEWPRLHGRLPRRSLFVATRDSNQPWACRHAIG